MRTAWMLTAVSLLAASASLIACSSDDEADAFAGSAKRLEGASTDTCSTDEDTPNPLAMPGAKEVYFSMPTLGPSDLGCRLVASGREPRAGQLSVALWQMGPNADKTPVTWRVGDKTGFSPAADAELATWQRGPNDLMGTSAAQMRGNTVGMWINTQSQNVATSGDIIPIVAHYDFTAAKAPMPFAEPGSELAYAFDAQVPVATSWGGGVPYAAAVFRFKDMKTGHPGREVWFSIQFFDPRGAADDVPIYDSCEKCSGFPILITSFKDGREYGRLAPGSATFAKEPFTGWQHYDFRLRGNELTAALMEAQAKFHLGEETLSSDPADYKLIHFNMNPEVYAPPATDAGPGGGGTIGMSARNITIARFVSPPTAPGIFDRVHVNAANGSQTGLMQVFFKTAASDFYDERKSIRVPFPRTTGNIDIVADFSEHPDWKGTITGVRVDPFDSSASDACFNVDSVSVTDSAGRVAQSWTFDGPPVTPATPFFGWNLSGLRSLWNDGHLWGACQSDGDPYFYTDVTIESGR